MSVTRVNDMTFGEFLRRERRVTCEFDPARIIYRVRVERRGGEVRTIEFTALELQSTRLPLYDHVASRFPSRSQADRLDRAAVRLLGPGAMALTDVVVGHGDRDGSTRVESRTDERTGHRARIWTPSAPRTVRRGVETPPGDAPPALAPPGSHVPMYRPR